MRRASLAAMATVALLVGGCSGPPANTGPSVTAQASTQDAAVGEPVVFTGAAYDPDGSIVRFEWDFDTDGTVDFVNATRGAASFAFARPGNFTATFRAFDDDGASAAASVSLRVIARFVINTDWGADAGFLIHAAEGLDPALMHVRASPTGAPAPIEYSMGAGLLQVNITTLRISFPRASLDLYGAVRVEVTYNGTKGGDRLVRSVPFLYAENDPALNFLVTSTETRMAAGATTTVAQAGALTFHYTPSRAVASFSGTGSSASHSEGGGTSANATYAFVSLNWNHSIATGDGAFVTTDYAWIGSGTVESSSPGGFTTNLTISAFEGRRYLGNLTFERAAGSGAFTGAAAGTGGTASYSLFGNQTLSVTDGNGIAQAALDLTETTSFNGTLGGATYTETNLSQRLDAASDRFVNPTIFESWNSTGRVGTTNISGGGSRYVDSDGDGRFNPDLRPAFPSDGQYFNGPAPDELAPADAFTVVNALGSTARLTVGPARNEVLAASGFATEAVVVGTVSGAVTGGGLTGTIEAEVVMQGAHGHLRLVSSVDLASATGSFSLRWVLSGRGG